MIVGDQFIITNGGVNFKDQQQTQDGPGEQINEYNTSNFEDLDSETDTLYVP